MIDTLGAFSNTLQKYLENMHIDPSIQTLEKYVLLGSVGNLQRTLECYGGVSLPADRGYSNSNHCDVAR